jgi:hypothetical protein
MKTAGLTNHKTSATLTPILSVVSFGCLQIFAYISLDKFRNSYHTYT